MAKTPSTTPLFKTPYNAGQFKTDHEVNNKPSMTIPDQSLSIKEIVRRFTRGLPIEGERVALYEGEDDIWNGIDPRTLDISEREAFRQDRQEELSELQSRLKKPKKEPKVLETIPTEDPQSLPA